MSGDQQQQWAASFPLGRMGASEDVALATLFLASKSSSWLTDVTLDTTPGAARYLSAGAELVGVPSR
jgi:NAD(P)-dependent dehydrogenase (short-subunit alcohol dehydrogenase family)